MKKSSRVQVHKLAPERAADIDRDDRLYALIGYELEDEDVELP